MQDGVGHWLHKIWPQGAVLARLCQPLADILYPDNKIMITCNFYNVVGQALHHAKQRSHTCAIQSRVGKDSDGFCSSPPDISDNTVSTCRLLLTTAAASYRKEVCILLKVRAHLYKGRVQPGDLPHPPPLYHRRLHSGCCLLCWHQQHLRVAGAICC